MKDCMARSNKDTPYLPEMTGAERDRCVLILTHFMLSASTACNTYELADEKSLPEWAVNHKKYWKNARSAFRWAIGQLKRKKVTDASPTRSGSVTAGELLSIGGDQSIGDGI